MYVKKIEMAGFRRPAPDGTLRGTIAFVAADQRVNVDLNIPHDLPPRDRSTRLQLLSEALRQLRRMPEFRNRSAALSFAPGLLPRSMQKGARAAG
ncbi:MAG: hypothetical protein QNJ09_08235 [Paracoccaceae bacterium]|nr:hypothetical protein [Paracoccaceae bacterium]